MQTVEAQLRAQVDGEAAWCGRKNSGFRAREAWVLILTVVLFDSGQ